MEIFDFTRNYGYLSKRTAEIKVVTIHSFQGNESTLAQMDEWYQHRKEEKKYSSSNYGIAYDGEIGRFVPEVRRAVTSNSTTNDNRALTVEVSTLGKLDKPRYRMYDKARRSLVELLVWICRQHKKKGLQLLTPETKFDDPADGFLGVTLHRWFSDTDCPGEDIVEKLPGVISEVNERLAPLFRVQLGAYSVRANAVKKLEQVKAAGFVNAFIATVER